VFTDRLVIRLHHLSLPVAFVGLLWYTRRQYFTGDDWEFIHRLIPGVGNLGMFAPHNEHWSTLPLVAYRVLFAVVGVRSYIPYMGVLLALHVLSAHLLWRIMVKAGADLRVATALTAVFLVLGSGADNITWAFQLGFVGSLAAGLGMVLVVLPPTRGRLLAAWFLGVISLMCSGLGPIMVAVAGMTALLRCGWRRALLVVVVPAVVYAVWLLTYGTHSTTSPLPHGDLALIPDYVVTGVTSAAAGISGLRFVGGLLLLPLAWWLIARAWHRPDAAPVVALAAGTLLFFVVVGIGRIGLGVAESEQSRYVYITAILLLPATAVALSQLSRRHVLAAGVVALAIGWGGIHNVRTLGLSVQMTTGVRDHAQARIILASHLVGADAVVLPRPPEYGTAPDLTWADLVYLVRHDDLPGTSLLPASALDMVTVASNVELASSSVPLFTVAAVPISATAAGSLSQASPGCVQAGASNPGGRPTVQAVYTQPASISIHAGAHSSITVRLFAASFPTIGSGARTFTLDGSGNLYLDVSLIGAVAVVQLPPGGATICGVTP
jgi:hypothetical protein